jgi:hypothetical protein
LSHHIAYPSAGFIKIPRHLLGMTRLPGGKNAEVAKIGRSAALQSTPFYF